MTNREKNERIKAVEEQMAKLQKELEDIRKENTSEWDFSEWNKIPEKIQVSVTLPKLGIIQNRCHAKMKFISKLTQFKYCYDRDYEPDWTDFEENKYGIYYSHTYSKYRITIDNSAETPESIYFSTLEIAQKCCDWLNAGCQED